MQCELVRASATDGLRLDGVLVAPVVGTRRAVSIDGAICLHGVAANFYTSSTLDGIRPALLALGVPVLMANTRGHDTVYMAPLALGRRRQGAAFETVDDCRLDIAGWLKLLTQRGLRRVLLIGHSLGGIKAVYSQSLEPSDAVVGVVAISPPRLSHRAFNNSLESSVYFNSLSTAEELVRAGKPGELFEAKFPFPMLITAAGYLDKYGPAERYNILTCAPHLPCPTLFTYGSKELQGPPSFAGMPEALRALPGEAPREIVTIADADHNYTGTHEALAAEISRWVAANFAVAAD